MFHAGMPTIGPVKASTAATIPATPGHDQHVRSVAGVPASISMRVGSIVRCPFRNWAGADSITVSFAVAIDEKEKNGPCLLLVFGTAFCPPTLVRYALPSRQPSDRLTALEREVLTLYASGRSYTVIAAERGNSVVTVRNTLYRIQVPHTGQAEGADEAATRHLGGAQRPAG